jgi:hypothetical protein
MRKRQRKKNEKKAAQLTTEGSGSKESKKPGKK